MGRADTYFYRCIHGDSSLTKSTECVRAVETYASRNLRTYANPCKELEFISAMKNTELPKGNISYRNFERIKIRRPVERLSYIADFCEGECVLDIGCLDETALVKKDTVHWLHGRISSKARKVIGIDNSSSIPSEGHLVTGPHSRISRGDATSIDLKLLDGNQIDVIVAGEFIEHIECPVDFLRKIKQRFPGKDLILSTPNGFSFSNLAMGAIGREVQHPDHLFNFTYKTLNTTCIKADLEGWEIIPYSFHATEMIMNSRGLAKRLIRLAAYVVRIIERIFPLLSFGYIVRAKL